MFISTCCALRRRYWCWLNIQARYLLRRLVRLWIVVLPALILTLIFDRIGMAIGGPEGYLGVFGAEYASLPRPDAPSDHSVATLLANAFFLQTILRPVFGSNAPLWSLAYEFWYYLLFPIALSTTTLWRSPITLSVNLVLLLLLICLLPVPILEASLIWIAGAVAGYVTPRLASIKPAAAWSTTSVALLVIFGTALWSEIPGSPIGDLALGLVVAVALPPLALARSRWKTYNRLVQGCANISYTLYVSHFPLLMMITMIGLAPARLQPSGLISLGIYAAFLFIGLVWALVLWVCFERHTNRLYQMLSGHLLRAGIGGSSRERRSTANDA